MFLKKQFLILLMTNKFSTYYDLEIDKLIEEINLNNYKKILLQFPDGLKYYGKEVVDEIKSKTSALVCIYFGSCYGACDLPLHLEKLNFDLCVQWGHAKFVKNKEVW